MSSSYPGRPKRAAMLSVCALLAGCASIPTQAGLRAALPAPAALDAATLESLRAVLVPMHQQYDPAERMLKTRFSSPGYHTTLKGGFVHPTRNSLHYAAALLELEEPALRDRGVEILRRVVPLQDRDPDSRTYGLWSWFLEEPLERMSPPDWNWADFNGTTLLQVALHHRKRVPGDLMAQVDSAIVHAARSIQRRNVGPGYTNIAIMGSYVTLVAGETYHLPELKAYAMQRLRRFHAYTLEHGAFSEYNSPTYTLVALQELGRLRQHARDPEARRLVEEIYRLAWEEIAHHFHAPTRQWAGPHSRAYRDLLNPAVPRLLHRATGGRLDFGARGVEVDNYRIPLPVPRDLEPYFTDLHAPRELVKTFIRGGPPTVGTTYLTPRFALGSVNQGDFWNQRRPLLAYWGTHERPAYLRVRLLKNGYDFAAAQLFAAQRQGEVLAAVAFATDGGDTHVSLDRLKNGLFRASDLRLRVELGGAARHAEIALPADVSGPVRIRSQGLGVAVRVPYAVFGEEQLRWEKGADGSRAWADLVLYRGADRSFHLGALQQAAIGLALRVAEGTPLPPQVAVAREAGRLRMQWETLEVAAPLRPAPQAELRGDFVARAR